MSIRPAPGAVHPGDSPDPELERIQREHELSTALEAARHLQARLELLGDRVASVRWLRTLRDDLATELARLGGDERDAVSGVLGENGVTQGREAEARTGDRR